MAIPTQFSVTSTRTSPIANPLLPQDAPSAADTKNAASINAPSAASAESVSILTGADIIPTLSVGGIDAPTAASALSVVILDTPSAANTQAQPATGTPSAASAESQPVISTPSAASTQVQPTPDTPVARTAKLQPSTEAPSAASAQTQPATSAPSAASTQTQPVVSTPSAANAEAAATATAPSALTANGGTLTTPPFPLNHPRFLVENKLQSYISVSATEGVSSTAYLSLVPNTFQRFTFDNNGRVFILLPSAVNVDTVCIGAHNLSDGAYTVQAFYREAAGGAQVSIAPSQSPSTNAAIMFHSETEVNAIEIEVRITGGAGGGYVGYISAGIALQMQRPIFNGHTPITDSDVTKYYHNKTESGNIIGQAIRSQGYKNSFEFQNIDDGWYRTYFAPFKQAIKTQPFFAAWNLLEYPEDVGFGRVAQDISTSMQNGTQIKRSSLSFEFLGY